MSPKKVTSTSSDIGLPDALASDVSALDAPVLTLALAHYSKEDLQSILKVCIDSIFQAQVFCPTESASYQKGKLKAKLPDFYYGKSHMEYYYFC